MYFFLVNLMFVILGLFIVPNTTRRTFSYLSMAYLLGVAHFILISHLISFLTHSYKKSILISILIQVIIILYFAFFKRENLLLIYSRLKKYNKKDSKLQIWVVLFAIMIGVSCYIRNKNLGIGDAQHLSYSINLLSNDFYPPRLILEKDTIFNFYHYGTDLLLALFKVTLPSSSIFEANGILLGFMSFLLVTLLATVLSLFVRLRQAFFLSLFVLFFMSWNFIPFFIKEIFYKKDTNNLILKLISIINVHSDSFPNNLSSSAVTSANVFLLLLIIQIFLTDCKKYKLSFQTGYALLITSFLLNFLFPAYWLPVCSAFLISTVFFAYKKLFLQELNFINILKTNFVKVSLILYVGKYLSFTSNESFINSINLLIFKPDLKWTIGYLNYLPYLFDLTFLQSLPFSFEERIGKIKLEVPLFSPITFIDFGWIILGGLLIYLFLLSSKNHRIGWRLNILFFSGVISFLPVFTFDYLIAPIEITRFLFWSKTFFLLFSLVNLAFFFRKNCLYHFSKAIIITFLLITMIPGIIYMIPLEKFGLRGYVFDTTHKKLVKALSSIQSSGKKLLFYNDDPLPFAYDAPYMSGFYSIGGVMLRPDLFTAKTAIFLLDTNLLSELDVDYILISKTNKLSEMAKQKLNNQNVFQEIKDISKFTNGHYYLFKFNNNILLTENRNYYWVNVYQNYKGDIQIVNNSLNAKKLYPNKKLAITNLTELTQTLLGNNQIIEAVFTRPQAISIL
jgi:hypothetical protein